MHSIFRKADMQALMRLQPVANQHLYKTTLSNFYINIAHFSRVRPQDATSNIGGRKNRKNNCTVCYYYCDFASISRKTNVKL